ncbi:hypothetical protein [Acidocella sp.]|uniref:hypothetical protein n=1 Tax=Acidocella sp. TaxID=50710 RepID=UPI003D030407
MLKTMFIALLLGLGLLPPSAARAAGLCAAHPNDDTLRPLPAALAPRVQQAFGLRDMTAAQTQNMTVMRCMDGKPYACFAGANLPCGKANMATNLPGTAQWCARNKNADFIPAYISGHDTPYHWRCRGGEAVIVAPTAGLDVQGFFTQYWKPL